jgi:7-cyano-7-deazaguanine synthase
MIPTNMVLLLSGGLDSTVLLYELRQKQKLGVYAVLFDYGQTHWRELDYAKWHCTETRTAWTLIEIQRVFKDKLLSSRLVGGKHGDVVHNRNAVMLSIACSIAAASNVEMVSYACNKDDQMEFPDCTWDFIEAMNAANKAAKLGVEIVAPYIGLTKRQIVLRAKELKVPIEHTWSCYVGGRTPCGKCQACQKRQAATNDDGDAGK